MVYQYIIDGMMSFNNPSMYWTSYNIPLIPELQEAQYIRQRNNETVFEHTMKVLDNIKNKNDITLLSALFHDLGKVKVYNPNNKYPFRYHADASSKILDKRLKNSINDEKFKNIKAIVKNHMIDLNSKWDNRRIMWFINTIGKNNIANWFEVRRADAKAYRDYDIYYDKLIDPFLGMIQQFIKNHEQDKIKFSDGLIING